MVKKVALASLLSILALIASVLVACRSSEEPAVAPSESAAAGSAAPAATSETGNAARPATPPDHAAGHAASQVKPGSYEDWCEEHQVPESLCTQCNPTLIAAFKATGDWCNEHALPESQCKVCHPELKIERPARTTREG